MYKGTDVPVWPTTISPYAYRDTSEPSCPHRGNDARARQGGVARTLVRPIMLECIPECHGTKPQKLRLRQRSHSEQKLAVVVGPYRSSCVAPLQSCMITLVLLEADNSVRQFMLL